MTQDAVVLNPRTQFRLALDDITPNNINQLRRLNTVLFPVRYKDRFYKDALSAGELCKMAYFNDVPVGGVVCRKDTIKSGQIDVDTSSTGVYIATLGVLAPYRNLGLGRLTSITPFRLIPRV